MRRRFFGRETTAAIRAALAGVAVMVPLLARAQAGVSSDGAVSVSANFDVANAYVLRGISQDDTGVIMWPAMEVGWDVARGGEHGRGRLRVSGGTWNSLHTGAAGLDGFGRLWYQSDLHAGVSLGVGAGIDVGATYLVRTSPNNAFGRITEMVVKGEHRDNWFRPYGLLAFEVQGQLDGGRSKGRYLEVGARPVFGRGVTLAVPVRLGLSLGDYYEGLRGDERFGFFSVGGVATAPLGAVAGGRWNVHGGADYLRLGERNELVFGKASQVVVSGGVGFEY